MIGQLILPVTASGEMSALRATLQDDFSWRCDDPEWATMLNAQFPGPMDAGLSASSGRFLLYRAAERLSARVVVSRGERALQMA
ncbi:MAG: hypothetical protein AAF328_01410 [Planctomycetota bacterium]